MAAVVPFVFLSTPSARRATGMERRQDRLRGISIHALREEGDLDTLVVTVPYNKISIHALREEGDRYRKAVKRL